MTGVRFTLGAFERGDPLGAATRIALTERLALTLVEQRGERTVRRLTPPGGARELLPAEYAYTLPARRAARAAARALRVPRGRAARRAAASRAIARLGAVRADEGRHALRPPRLPPVRRGARRAASAIRATHRSASRRSTSRADDELFKRYLERIPVIALDGEELYDFFVDEEALRRKL